MNTRARLVTALSAVTSTTTSTPINIENVKRLTLFLKRANHTSGSSAFKAQVSLDGVTYLDFNSLIQDLTNTNAQTKTRATTITLSSNTSVIASLDLAHHFFKWLQIVATITTDGDATAKALIQDEA